MKSKWSRALKQADDWFSKYIRLSERVSKHKCRCITCGQEDHWKKMDAGHFIKRRFHSLRFNPINVHVQCKQCNQFDKEMDVRYKEKMINHYGEEMVEALKNKKNEVKKYTVYELRSIAKYCRLKVKNLLNESRESI